MGPHSQVFTGKSLNYYTQNNNNKQVGPKNSTHTKKYDSNSPGSKGCILSDEDDEIREFNTPIEKTFKEDYFQGGSKTKERK